LSFVSNGLDLGACVLADGAGDGLADGEYDDEEPSPAAVSGLVAHVSPLSTLHEVPLFILSAALSDSSLVGTLPSLATSMRLVRLVIPSNRHIAMTNAAATITEIIEVKMPFPLD
jgi:hypothetical protein